MLKTIYYLTLSFGIAAGFPVDTALVIFFGFIGAEHLYKLLFSQGIPKNAVYHYKSEN